MIGRIYNHDCTLCPLYKEQDGEQIVCVGGVGNWGDGAMIIGEAPGANEALGGEPFIGAAGAVLDSALERCGISRSDVFITNTVKCRPPGNRKPTEEEELACSVYLVKEIEIIKPHTIMTLGNHALRAITGYWGITTYAGCWFERNDCSILPNYHPAYVLYNRKIQPVFESIIEKWAEQV